MKRQENAAAHSVRADYGMRWCARMAWRDARKERRRLLFCMLSIVFGVAALVVVLSLGHNLRTGLDRESKALLGADLVMRSATPFSERAEQFFAGLGGRQSREVRFTSMAAWPEQDATRLVLVRAIQGGFPFYGEWVVAPESVDLDTAAQPLALVDDSLFVQYGLAVGDPIKLGKVTFTIAGRVKSIPGESAFSSVFAPRVYIAQTFLEATGLLQFGSVVRHRAYFEFPAGFDTQRLDGEMAELVASERLRYETVETRKERIGNAIENVYRFIQLVGWVALLLGSIGIAGAVHVYLQSKFEAVALLRCLGVSRHKAFLVFWLQVMAVAVLGVGIGTCLGAGLQSLLPSLLLPFLPFDLAVFFSWRSIWVGFLFGLSIAVLFSMLPLLPVRTVSPLRALRARVEGRYAIWRDRWALLVIAAIGTLFLLFSIWQVSVWWHGVLFCLGCIAVFVILYALAGLLRFSLKWGARGVRSFVVGQGIKNLYRPNNRTLYVMIALGMGTFLVFTVYLVEYMLLNQTDRLDRADEPNVLFFDVQSDQREELYALIEAEGLAVIEEAPVVTMRLVQIKDRSVASIRKDSDAQIESWILNREWRSTYRDRLKASTESLVEGTFVGQWEGLTAQPVPISMERGMAEDLGIWTGDKLVFDVQGIPVETVVTSIREVDWQRMRSNFFTVFPTGVLEAAPTFYIAFTQTGGAAATAELQQKVVATYPNITTVDLGLILGSLQTVLDRVAYVIRFMGSFAIITGLIVLVGAVITSRYQRARESVLLRTMGASARQILGIVTIEYVFLGLLSAAVGMLLSGVAAWGLGIFLFKVEPNIPIASFVIVMLSVTALTTFMGVVNSYSIATRPPLDVLRDE